MSLMGNGQGKPVGFCPSGFTKKRISSIAGSDLEMVLRSRNIDTLIITGVSSLGVVESTAHFAFDLDYRLFILGDCCSDRDPEANEIAITRLLPRISTAALRGSTCQVFGDHLGTRSVNLPGYDEKVLARYKRWRRIMVRTYPRESCSYVKPTFKD